MRIVCCQLDIVWENKAANHAKVRALLGADRPAPDSLIILPEMFSTGFSMNVAGICDNETLETETFLSAIAREFHACVLGGVVNRASDGRGLNQAVAFSPEGKTIARYSKMQPFTLGGESQHYAAGREGVTFKWNDFLVAPFVCYDLRFPELFRKAILQGVHLFPVIASWPVTREQHWVTLLQARAIENQAYVVGVNRCGNDPALVYPGRSMVIDPSGEILADAGSQETLLSADLDLDKLRTYREKLPFLKDMRSDPR